MKNIRKDFPILEQRVNGNPLIYFDNAATTHKPQCVLDALINFYTKHNANIHRSIHVSGEQATGMYEAARANVANFIGAQPEEIVFTKNATESINAVASAWAKEHIKAGDEILVSELEHHSNLMPWQRLAQQNKAVLKFIPIKSDGTLDLSMLPVLLSDKTKLVVVSHVSNALGTHNDIQSIIQQAHAVGAKVLIDASQSVPHQKIDVQQLGCDFLVFSGHKMLGPTGIGVLYINKALHDQLQPYQLGGGMIYEADFKKAVYLPMPHLLEAGTPPIAQAIGLGAAIDYIQKNIDFDALQKHEAALCERFINGLQKIKGIKVLGPIEQLKKGGHLVSFVVEGIHPHDVAAYLSEHGIFTRAGHQCAQPLAKKLGVNASTRASFYAYNTQEEVDACLDVLQQLVAKFK